MRDKYTYNEIMYQIPYDSLILQYISVTLPKKEETIKKEENVLNFFKTL